MNGAASHPAESRFVDLHMHSTASDGARSPTAVAESAATAGLGAIALTDHDTVSGIEEAVEAGSRLGLRVVAGVELSAMDGGSETHVLGLHLSRLASLDRHLAMFRETRYSRAERIVELLNKLGMAVSMADVTAQSRDGAIGRPHIARALVEGGWVRDIREAFERYLGTGCPANVEKHRITLTEAFTMIHEAGGLAILAHPGADGSPQKFEALITGGLDGVEVRHPSHSTHDITRLTAIAENLNLVPSGGSDWHGAASGVRALGSMRVPAEWLERQDIRVRERASRGGKRVA